MKEIFVCNTTDIVNSDKKAFTIEGRDIVIANYEGDYFAFDDLCTHADALLSEGDLDQNEIECPVHFGRFDIKTGKALSGPVEEDIKTYQLSIKENQIFILIPNEQEG